MFKRIHLQNFQCHKQLSLTFGKITTLVGPSDSGKSALMRALDWVCFNKGSSSALVKRGENYTTVELEVDNHRIVRSTRDNSYRVDSTVMRSIGRNIPAEVGNILKLSEDNVQRQHDYLFWFSATGSALVSYLNKIVDLTKLEDWVHAGVLLEKKYKDKASYYENRQTDLDHEIVNLIEYRAMDKDLVVLEQERDELSALRSRYDGLVACVGDLGNIDNSITLLKAFVDELSALILSASEYVELIDRYYRLIDVHNMLMEMSWKIADLQKISALLSECDELATIRERYAYLKEFSSIYSISLPSLDEINTDFAQLVSDSRKSRDLADILRNLGSNEGVLAKTRQNLEGLKEEFARRSEGICPICGQTFNDGALHWE